MENTESNVAIDPKKEADALMEELNSIKSEVVTPDDYAKIKELADKTGLQIEISAEASEQLENPSSEVTLVIIAIRETDKKLRRQVVRSLTLHTMPTMEVLLKDPRGMAYMQKLAIQRMMARLNQVAKNPDADLLTSVDDWLSERAGGQSIVTLLKAALAPVVKNLQKKAGKRVFGITPATFFDACKSAQDAELLFPKIADTMPSIIKSITEYLEGQKDCADIAKYFVEATATRDTNKGRHVIDDGEDEFDLFGDINEETEESEDEENGNDSVNGQ